MMKWIVEVALIAAVILVGLGSRGSPYQRGVLRADAGPAQRVRYWRNWSSARPRSASDYVGDRKELSANIGDLLQVSIFARERMDRGV